MNDFDKLLTSMADADLWTEARDERDYAVQALLSGEDAAWTGGGAWRADGEDLAEGDVESWLSAMTPALRHRGVNLRVTTLVSPHEQGSPGYSVAVNGAELNLYHLDPSEPGVPTTADPWLDCTVQPLAAVNRLLAEAGSPARVGVFWPGGNDGLAVLGNERALRRAADISGISDFVVP